MRLLLVLAAATSVLVLDNVAEAFCGFYVARADSDLFNQASEVVMVRDGDRTVITMANDFRGNVEDFAVVIPVPTFIERGQINVADPALIERLDAYTAPRLVEYHDPDPCAPPVLYEMRSASRSDSTGIAHPDSAGALTRGVTIEASYTVGEYDILILSAAESAGLIDWLDTNGYRIPAGAERVVASYLRQDMRFFVAKVNLEQQSRLGYARLRPLQVAYESRRFMLPIRLGTLNARGKQELYVYALTRSGRVETTNYRTVKLPSDVDLPEFIADEFATFYRDMFERQVERDGGSAVFLEYAWDMAWCDPCAANPLSTDELERLGVFWLGTEGRGRFAPKRGQDVFVTRLHLRYDRDHFPEDLMFKETGDRRNFQGRYVIRHPWRGAVDCDASDYLAATRDRQEQEAESLANLAGWDLTEIRGRIDWLGSGPSEPWWRRLWR